MYIKRYFLDKEREIRECGVFKEVIMLINPVAPSYIVFSEIFKLVRKL